MKHATVKIDGKDIPLIGIPATSTEDKCDFCNRTFHLSELMICLDNLLICEECFMKPKD